eukprot:scaffold6743_cov110-Skeletonema_dohrnii-CCMP3373.AAC.1
MSAPSLGPSQQHAYTGRSDMNDASGQLIFHQRARRLLRVLLKLIPFGCIPENWHEIDPRNKVGKT